ncbi:uncharacterized protein LOC116193705 [Punica granatum]|uniref:Uncharacterized protein LOC116193705 n=1 Tax=Punica granatum TaxID=22663 RepID=A0A6P8CB37_PUNGR|nr:uncharacterized protein LOC116193705 [Punica granatum]
MAEDDYYTVVFHHGGVLVSEPHMEYIGGVVDSWANVDIDRILIPFVEWRFEELYGDNAKYKTVYWLDPGLEVKDGLRPLENDTDVRMLYSIVHEKAQNKEIHFYFEHEDEVEVIDGDSEDDDCGDSEDDVYKPRHEDEGGDSEDNEDDADDEDHEDDEDEIVVDIGSGTVGCSGNPMPKSKKPKKQKWRACNGRPRYPNIEDVQRPHEARNTVDDADDEGGYHSDQMGSIRGDSDDEGRYEIKPPQFNEAAPFGQVDLQLYMLFPTLKMLKQAVKDYTIALGRPVKQVKADKGRCKYTCEQGCDWNIFCSWAEVHGSYQIKTFNPTHTCSRKLKNHQATSKWVADKLVEFMRQVPDMTAVDAFKYMASTFQVRLADMKIYRAMRIAREVVEGSEKDQYEILMDYCMELLTSNAGSTVGIHVERPDLSFPAMFDRLYCCFDACKKGVLSGCCPLIGLDGCFLKGYYGGTLLVAVSQDGNHSFYVIAYVIAYAIIGQETKDTWSWFLTRLFEDIGHPKDVGCEFISDMQKGLLPAMEELAPGTKHRFCLRHLEVNIWNYWRIAELRNLLWDCARCLTMLEFEKKFLELKELSMLAWTYLNNLQHHNWTRVAFSTTSKNCALTNNMSKQFNAAIVKMRGKPIISMLEEIRVYLMNKMNKIRKQLTQYRGPITPAAQTKLEVAK